MKKVLFIALFSIYFFRCLFYIRSWRIYSDIIFSLITNKELLVIDGVDYKYKLYDLLKGKKIDYPEEYLPFKVDAEQSISLLYETKEQYQYDIFKEMIPD